MKKLFMFFTVWAAFITQPFLFGQSTIIAATKILNNTGALLSSGQFCVGSSCHTVTTGAITSTSIVSTTATVTVTNGGATTYLTIPSVTVSGAYWSFDTYVVPSTANITGIGTPRIACQPGAIYTQTDGDQNKWACTTINGIGTWNGVQPPPPSGGGGTVTSIGISWPSIFCISGPNPVTSSGTIIASLCNAPANTIFAGPISGSATTPVFRSLGVADMPFTYSGNTTKLGTVSGGLTQGLALTADASGNIITAGSGTVLPGTIDASQVSGLAPSATIDTTNASNITSGTIGLARLPSTSFSCPTGQAVGSFALNNSTPTCLPFQGVIATGLLYEIPTYIISGGGTTLGPSLATVDISGNIGGANITASGTLSAGATTVSSLTSSGAISGTTISGTGLSITGSFTANQVYASPNGSAGNLGLRALVTADLPSSVQNTVASQSANLVYASPNGSAGAPGFRAVATADLPFTYSGNTAELATTSGTLTAGQLLTVDSSGNVISSGSSSSCTVSSFSDPGYTVCNGIIEQWGTVSMGSGDTNFQTATYPYTGTVTSCYSASATTIASGTTNRIALINSYSTSSISLENNGSGASILWHVWCH